VSSAAPSPRFARRQPSGSRIPAWSYLLALAVCLVLAWQPAVAAEGLKVEQPWARASLAGVRNGIVYGRLIDEGSATVDLVSASSPVAVRVEFHEHSMSNGVMTMRQLDSIEVKPGAFVQLLPGGLHIMLFDLKRPLKAGDSFPLTLKLADGESVTVSVPVLDATAAGP
jgi:periplasmic copper chaperone A